jgi:hypothetical protein
MIRGTLFVVALLGAFTGAQTASASFVNANVDFQFANPLDSGSGGTWVLSAEAGNFGLAGITVYLNEVDSAVNFLISPAVFEVQMSAVFGGGLTLNVVAGDDLGTPTLGVGVGSPVDIIEGTFAPGDSPVFASASANVFNAASVAVTASSLTPTVTTNLIPEPTTLALLGAGLVGLIATRRRA